MQEPIQTGAMMTPDKRQGLLLEEGHAQGQSQEQVHLSVPAPN